jgi:hypothetical protein
MEAKLTGRAATEALMLYTQLGQQRFDAAKVRADVAGRGKRAVRRIRSMIAAPRPAYARLLRPRPRECRPRATGRPLRRRDASGAVPGRPGRSGCPWPRGGV